MNLEEARRCLADYRRNPVMRSSRSVAMVPDTTAAMLSSDGDEFLFLALRSHVGWDIEIRTLAEYEEWRGYSLVTPQGRRD